MESVQYIHKLQSIPCDFEGKDKSYKRTLAMLIEKDTADCFIEASVAAEAGLLAVFNERNVSDTLLNAYRDAFRGKDISLYEHYMEQVEKGEESVRGFISALKGKVFEYELPDRLKEIYKGYDFRISENVTQPIWDIEAIDLNGTENFLIQAKMWNGDKASELIELMHDNIDIMYATSSEIRDAVLERAPELAEQFIPDIDISNYDFTEEVAANLETLAENFGMDLPDGMGEILPYLSEITLGIRLLLELIRVQRDFKHIDAASKARLSAVKTIMLLSRFGVTSICTLAGGSAGAGIGSILPGIGNFFAGVAGSIGGGFLARKINEEIKPYMLEIALGLTGLEDEDMFYFNNKVQIDQIALSYSLTNKHYEQKQQEMQVQCEYLREQLKQEQAITKVQSEIINQEKQKYDQMQKNLEYLTREKAHFKEEVSEITKKLEDREKQIKLYENQAISKEEYQKLQEEQKSYKTQYRKLMKQLKAKEQDISFAYEMLEEERQRQIEQEVRYEQLLKQQEEQKEKNEKLAEKQQESKRRRLGKDWRKLYYRFDFEESAIRDVVKNFAYDEVLDIQVRLMELHEIDDLCRLSRGKYRGENSHLHHTGVNLACGFPTRIDYEILSNSKKRARIARIYKHNEKIK